MYLPTFSPLAENADCKAAASSWIYCQNEVGNSIPQNAVGVSIPTATQSELKTCICSSGQGNSSQPDWYPSLTSCIQCIENAGEVPPGSVLTPLQAIEIDFCITGTLTYNDFFIQAHNIAANAGLPLELPQAIFVSIQTGISTSSLQTGTSTPDSCAYPTSHKVSTQSTAVTTSAPVAKSCNYDNCLRQAIQSEDVALGYCETYTVSIDAATAGHPDYVSMCNNSPMSISSACTCLVSAQTPNPTQTTSNVPTESHTTTNAGIATTMAKSSIHYTTHWVTTIIYITPGGHSTAAPGTSSTSCTETLSTLSTQVVKSSTSGSSSSSHTLSSSPVKTSSSSTSTSAASAAATWITLPPSTEMKACAGNENPHSSWSNC